MNPEASPALLGGSDPSESARIVGLSPAPLQHFHDADREGCTACQEPQPPAGFTMTDKGWWCADHGYGCEPQNCPCGHTLRCDCWSIANEC